MVTGLATGLLGGPPLLLWAGYGVAYVFGGWYGLKGELSRRSATARSISTC